ncbi:GATA transcription factor 12-like [Bidens hawaiensis]|uniref:GATA transcription factor 12-like n=1 Tax=Bidens hawaiensis TaxID=980011 RepID=UPI004049F1B9
MDNTFSTPDKHFIIDDLLNFPTDDTPLADDHQYDVAVGDVAKTATSTDSSVVTTTTNNVVRSLTDAQFSHDLAVPYDDMAELEWLSNFVEDSFSTEDMEKIQLISGVKSRPCDAFRTPKFEHDTDDRTSNQKFNKDMSVQGKARTKRSRIAPCNWNSWLISISQHSVGTNTTLSSESDMATSSIVKKAPPRKKEVYDNESNNGEGRKCLHCATDKTPQWRTGPLGPKTLCNACGVRYKSGRLVPEYRPAASPTFVLTKHSNSHRKVLELRRQKEMQSAHQQPFFHHPSMMFDVSKGDEYLIHQHIGPDYRQLI